MAQTDFLSRETVTYLGASVTFGSRAGATLYRLACEQGSVLASGFMEDRLEVPDERQVRYDNPKRVRGLKSRASKWGPLKVLLKGIKTANKLDPGGAVGALSQRPFFKHGFGREYAALGCTVGVGSTTSVLVVDSTTDRRCGELIAVEITAGVFEVAKIGAVTDATHLALVHALSAAPATTRIVRGMYGYYCPETKNDALVIEQAFVGEATSVNEYRALGCYGALKWEFGNWGDIVKISMDGQCVDWQGPTTLAAPVFGSADPADDDMDEAIPWVPLLHLGATIDRSLDTPYRIEKCSFEHMTAWDPIPDGSKSQAVGGVLDTAGRESGVFGKLTLTIRSDPAELTRFTARTDLTGLITCQDQGLTSLASWEFGKLYLVAPPKPVSLGKGRGGAELTFEVRMDSSVTLPVGATTEEKDMARSPVRFGMA